MSSLTRSVDNADRARCALTLLLERLLSNVGYLYVRSADDKPSLIAALLDPPRDPDLQASVDRYAHDWLAQSASNDNGDDTRSTTAIDDATASGTETRSGTMAETATGDAEPAIEAHRYIDADGRALEAVLLMAGQGRDRRLAAVLVVESVSGQRASVPYALSNTLARELLQHGDSVGWR